MKFWPFKKTPLDLSLVFDIGSSTIGAALVELHDGTKPTVHYTVRKPIAFQKQIDPVKLLFDKKNTLADLMADVLRFGLPNVGAGFNVEPYIVDIHCLLGSPWYMSKTLVVKVEKPEAFLVTEDSVMTLISLEEARFAKSFSAEADGFSSVSVIEKKIVHAKLNGYEVSDIYLKQAQSLELSLFLSAAEPNVLKQIRSVLHPATGFRKIYFHSFPLAYFSVARDIFQNKPDFLIVDVRGEVTDVTLVHKNALAETTSIPLGKHFLLRKASGKLNLTPEVAASFVKLYLSGKAEGFAKKDMEEVLSEVEDDWRMTFRATLSDLSQRTLLPDFIYVMADFDFGSLFAGWIAKEKNERLGISAELFHVEYIHDSKWAEHLVWAKRARHDAFLAVAALFLSKLGNQ